MIILPVVLASFALFSRAQMTVPVIPPLTKGQQLAFSIAMTEMSQTPAAQDMLAQDVNNAVAAAAAISQNFTRIAAQLVEVDNLHLQNQTFEPTWSGFRDRFNTILQQSKNFAGEVATYAAAFDAEALGIVTNTSLDLETRQEAIKLFIDQATAFQSSSDSFATMFKDLASDMDAFTGNFANFASGRTTADNATIDNLNIQITKMQGQMEQLSDSMLGLGVAAGGVVIATPIAIGFFPVFAPFIVIGAAILEGLIAAAEVGLEIAFSVEQAMVDTLQSEKQTLLDEISLINSTQNLLNQMVTQNIVSTASSVQLFGMVWQGVANDSSSIHEWLVLGAPDAASDMPEVIGVFVSQSVSIYRSLAGALATYAVS
ncbi:hypothetical protein FB45DRAFT_1022460 [Roridomyces roridus]|uniref:Uncharacterized protein n=1 Tax=Roridomyces roridus TaxID=1738132 RepID=A0AAD7C844_9AGAR|nr:hypothetical protein FB45DRAFT_1022460 [Roridomyces roridus]